MTELLPCPFCWGEELEIDHAPTYNTIHPDVYKVHCCDCGADGSEEWTEAVAVAAWNTRYERTCRSVFDGNMDGTSVCSECGGEFPQDPDRRWRLNYCPNCGARVIGGERHSWRELENSDQYIAAAHAFDTTNHNTCCERGE